MAVDGLVLLARSASSRLPGKATAVLGRYTLVEHCLRRLQASRAGQVVLATTTRPDDDVLAVLAGRLGLPVFRGDAEDVLGRTLEAARVFGFERVVRATGDNPFVDIDSPRRTLALLAPGIDYACEDGLPLGGGVEAVTFEALERSAREATDRSDREHVTTYIKRHPETYRVVRAVAPAVLRANDLRLTVDTADDLIRARLLLAATGEALPALGTLIAAASSMEVAS